VIDNSSAFRMAPNVPLVVPEVNEEAIQGHQGIIANPTAWPPRWWWRSSRSPTPSTGARDHLQLPGGLRHRCRGIAELRRLAEGYLVGDEPDPSVYPHPIAFNVLPHIDTFDETGYTSEERKVIAETARCSRCRICRSAPPASAFPSSTAIRLDPNRDHRPAQRDAARGLLMGAPGLILVDQPSSRVPAAAAGERTRRGDGRTHSQRPLAPAGSGTVDLQR